MPTAVIPFVNNQASGLEELGGMSPLAMNVVIDQSATVKRRPGITTYEGYPVGVVQSSAAISGVYGTNHRQLFAVSEAKPYGERLIYSLAGGAVILGGGKAPYGLRGTLRPVFAETELLLTIAGGDLVQKIELGSNASSRLGSTTPAPTASHIVANNLRLLANDLLIDRTKVRFSDIAAGDTTFAGNEVWSLGGVGDSGYFSAEAKPDDVVAVLTTASNVLVVGTGTTQAFQPDTHSVYAPIGTLEVGMSAPYSAVRSEQSFFWLDDKRRFVMTSGSSFQDISPAIKRDLDAITTISDCFGYRVVMGYLDAICWTFPTDGRTFVYQKGAGWGQWSGYDDNNFAPFQVNCHHILPAYAPTMGAPESTLTNVVGTLSGHVGKLSIDASSDTVPGSNTTTSIQAKVRTGFLNHKTDAKKHCQSIRVALRRGDTTTNPQGMIRYRDDTGAWNDPLPVDFGASGDTEIVVTFRSLGTYRRRQWEWEFTGSENMTLVSVTEDFSVLKV